MEFWTFKVWWGSFAGQFAVERTTDEKVESLYRDLAYSLQKKWIEPFKALHISLLYDECVLVNANTSSYFAVLPIRDFFVAYKELVPRLQGCFD
ncbi:hypothetical protein [Robertmurraya andreesenii]|uniref:Uncharacterized protein n=1 Tax=Anoxybacillus andreesenii TaxID=1325932 RepID=A0ABT9UZ30_9BACL|nr:hypothetical protein [Robertmurraya andreesenii]MDQ0153951.1 hypothetical protein [Robertmurraya andreesenii]